MPLQLYEHVYKPRAGGMTAKAVTRTIAGTDLSQTEVLLREAVQNSDDAHADNGKALDVRLNCYQFSDADIMEIKKLFEGAGEIGREFSEKLSSSFCNLEISDRNTTGLTGYNGFQENEGKTEEKFHHFVYMTGNDEMKNKDSGGSFGFGKAALYRYSTIRTIVVYSRVRLFPVNRFQSRFIICRIDERLPERKSRCWWGAEGHYADGTSYAMPINDSDADSLAKLFGMTPFEDSETGTDILILNPVSKNFKTTFTEEIPDLICHWFWPRIITGNERKRINFQLFLDGDDITENIPNPKETYPYSTFSKAFRICTDYFGHKVGSTNGVFKVSMDKPFVDIGAIFLKKTGVEDFIHDTYIHTDFTKPQIVLMRDVEFIVKYKEVDVDTGNSGMTCFGVFHTNRLGHQRNGVDKDEIEQYFRQIENQTHTEWTHDKSLPHDYLKKVMKALPESVKQCLEISSHLGSSSTISGLVAQKLGAKLGFGFMGGASDEINDMVNSRNIARKRTSSFVRSNKPIEFRKYDGNSLLEISYKSEIRDGYLLHISFIPVIVSSDPREKEVAKEDEIKVVGLRFIRKINGENEIPEVISKSDSEGFYKIKKNGVYKLLLEASIDCAFDIQVKKEEVNGR